MRRNPIIIILQKKNRPFLHNNSNSSNKNSRSTVAATAVKKSRKATGDDHLNPTTSPNTRSTLLQALIPTTPGCDLGLLQLQRRQQQRLPRPLQPHLLQQWPRAKRWKQRRRRRRLLLRWKMLTQRILLPLLVHRCPRLVIATPCCNVAPRPSTGTCASL